MDWSEVEKLPEIRLNLGGRHCCHPLPGYQGYVAVDLEPVGDGWSVRHDLREPLPLPDGSVKRIHSEDFIEHILPPDIERLLHECHRVLSQGGVLRIACPDYNNPKDRHAFDDSPHDRRDPLHVTRTDRALVESLIRRSPFEQYHFYHYWEGDRFVQEPFDHSLGTVRRTPENDPRCRRDRLAQKVLGYLADGIFRLKRGGRASEAELLTRHGRRLHVTSLVVELTR